MISKELVFSNDDNANSAVVGMYLSMYRGVFAGGGIGSLPWLLGMSADELHYNPETDPAVIEIEKNQIETDNIYVTNLWAAMYKSVYSANSILNGLENSSGISLSKKNQFKGEALFVRAFSYFYLVNVFGDVPLVLTIDYQLNAGRSKTAQKQVYEQVEADLLAADSLLTEDYPTPDRVRPNKFTALALLARLYLYRHDWEMAAYYSTKIISKSTYYSFSSDLNTVFLSTSKEAIWQLKPIDNAYYTNEAYAFDRTNYSVLTDTLIHSFTNNDQRKLDWSIGVGSIYLPRKYKIGRVPGTEYSMVFRLAELYLIRAEARTQLGNIFGNDGALSDINTIRRRAALSDTSASDLTEVMRIIQKERKLELFTEWGHRWLDLKRWNKATEALAPLKAKWNITDTIYPIPQSEINKNRNLKPQNTGY